MIVYDRYNVWRRIGGAIPGGIFGGVAAAVILQGWKWCFGILGGIIMGGLSVSCVVRRSVDSADVKQSYSHMGVAGIEIAKGIVHGSLGILVVAFLLIPAATVAIALLGSLFPMGVGGIPFGEGSTVFSAIVLAGLQYVWPKIVWASIVACIAAMVVLWLTQYTVRRHYDVSDD